MTLTVFLPVTKAHGVSNRITNLTSPIGNCGSCVSVCRFKLIAFHYSKDSANRTAAVLKREPVMFLRNVGTIYQTPRYHKVTVCILFKDKLINMSEGFLACVKSVLVITQLAVPVLRPV